MKFLPPESRQAYPERGYSLVELSVVLVIVGLLGLLTVRLIQMSRAPTDRAEILQQLAQAQQTVDAFVLRNHRLPCAALEGNGSEACGSTLATALPWRTLGLPSSFAALRYGVDRGLSGGVDLAAMPAASISPTLTSSYPDLDNSPTYARYMPANATATKAALTAYKASVDSALGLTSLVNGLDWCHGLRKKVSAGAGLTVGAGANSMGVVYAIAHPGADRGFSGLNAAARVAAIDAYIDSPARTQSADYDDIVWATGAAELLARMGCNVRLAQALTSAQETFAAYDNARLLEKHWLMVDTGVETAFDAIADAEMGVTMAALGLALGTTASVMSIASAVNTEGMVGFQVASAALNLAAAIVQVVEADEDLTNARQDFVDAKAKLDSTNDYVAGVFAQLKDITDRAIASNQKGLTP